VPVQVAAQQYPSEHAPLEHCELAVQVEPFASFGTHALPLQ
jgi:hypothetical protein